LNNNILRHALSFLIIVSIFTLSISNGFAQSNNEINLTQANYFAKQEIASTSKTQEFVAPRFIPIGAVVVFVSGIIVGYVVDGIFIYATGHSAGELTSTAIKKIVAFVKLHLGASSVYYNRSTGKVGMGGGGGGGW
jgi:uncharacterized membrane protein YjgN (DUF898 family)